MTHESEASFTSRRVPQHAAQCTGARVTVVEPTVVIVGTPATRGPVQRVLADHPVQIMEVDPTADLPETPSLWVCTTAPALRAVVDRPAEAPIIIIDSVVPTAVSPPAVPGLIDSWITGDVAPQAVPYHTVCIGETQLPMVLDLVLSTDAVAQISEFAVTHHAQQLHEVRADGITVAGPVGSGGYANALGAPRLGAVAGLIIVPMAAFASHSPVWVTPPPMSIRLLRKEAAVSASIDAQDAVSVDPAVTVSVMLEGTYDVLGQW